MLEDKEKKLVYFAVAIIILLLIVMLLIIWIPMFSNKEEEKDISSINTYEDDYYIKKMTESYKTVVTECVNEDNFDSTYLLLDDNYLDEMNMSENDLKAYLKEKGIITHPTSTAVIYCSSLRNDNERYVYTYVYKIGNTERKVHIIEDYYGKYTVSFAQDSYPVIDNNEYTLTDKNTGLEFKVKAVNSFDENLVMEVTIINSTTEEFTFKFSSTDDSYLTYNNGSIDKKSSLSSIVVGSQTSEFTSIPGSTNTIKLSYGVNIDYQVDINQICFNNVKRINGDYINIEMMIK